MRSYDLSQQGPGSRLSDLDRRESALPVSVVFEEHQLVAAAATLPSPLVLPFDQNLNG
jgi:hypothetical protein